MLERQSKIYINGLCWNVNQEILLTADVGTSSLRDLAAVMLERYLSRKYNICSNRIIERLTNFQPQTRKFRLYETNYLCNWFLTFHLIFKFKCCLDIPTD